MEGRFEICSPRRRKRTKMKTKRRRQGAVIGAVTGQCAKPPSAQSSNTDSRQLNLPISRPKPLKALKTNPKRPKPRKPRKP